MKVHLPYGIKLRDYQYEVWDAFFNEGKDRFINVWHRRAGKDKVWLNIMIAVSQLRVGVYYYTFPKLNQARKVIWEGIDDKGKRFLDHIPASLIKKVNNSEMTIQFKNGSLLRLGGIDHYDSLMGTNPVGMILSEFSLQNPLAWQYFEPILIENKGWATFVFTPRGTNHAYTLYKNIKNNKADNANWFCNLLTVEDTKRNDGRPVISEEEIEKARKSGMSEDMIQQEFYCSFTAAVPGAYFSSQLKRANEQNRIKDFNISTKTPVYTYWDLGISDKTAIWLMQYINDQPHMVRYYENHGREIQHYINFLYDFRDKYGIVYARHYFPHDSAQRNLQTGKTMISFVRELGLLPVEKVRRCKNKMDAIELARHALDEVIIHKTNCEHGLSCLREYHAEFYDKIGEYGSKPFHNWASHGADAFMTYAQSNKENHGHPSTPIFYNAIDIKL